MMLQKHSTMVSSTTIRSSARGMGFDAFNFDEICRSWQRGPITYMQKVLEEGLSYEPETYAVIEDEGWNTSL